MIKSARELIIREMTGDTDIFTSVGGRVYPHDVATLKDPVYPCATLKVNSGESDGYIEDIGNSPFLIQIYSNKSYSQCWDIYEKIKTFLSFGVFTNSSVRIRVTEFNKPFERYDEFGRINIVVSAWNVYMLGT